MARARVLAAIVVTCLAAPASAGSASAQVGAAQANADCSPATAHQVAGPASPWGQSVTDPLVQVLCGPFAGPGSQAMAVTFAAPTCWSPQGWSVYRFTGSAWELVFNVPYEFLSSPLVAVGGDLQETTPVFRPGNSRCGPTGGTRARTWHWDGTQLVAGPWHQVTPGQPPVKQAVVFAPSPFRVSCHMIDDGTTHGSWVYCWVGLGRGQTPHVKLGVDGRISRTVRKPLPQGIGGPSLAFGRARTAGRFRCQSRRAGMRCVVVASGRGFLFDGRKATAVVPA
jgi:hypothetical protein